MAWYNSLPMAKQKKPDCLAADHHPVHHILLILKVPFVSEMTASEKYCGLLLSEVDL